MSLSFLAPSRTVLITSDEALYIYDAGARRVTLVDTVPWTTERFDENVAAIIARECGGKPVLILNDMVEQHYRKEKVPRVSVMDKSNVLQRKLKVAFPHYPVRAALPLNEKVAKTDKSIAGDVYIFAAVPATEAFAKTMAAVRRSLAPVTGLYLLPVEACDMISALAEKLAKRDRRKEKAKWTVFIGQHHGGGLRQIVTRNGKLALTRMTPVIDNDDDPAQWANEINQEFKATMSYLSRFGYNAGDTMDIILISNSSPGEMMREMIEVQCNFYSMTPREAASILGFNLGSQDLGHYADSLHAGWNGRKATFILPMKAKEIDRVSKPRQLATLLSVLLLLGGAFQAYQLFDNFQIMSEHQTEIDDTLQKKAQLDLQYQKEVKRKEDLGFDIQLIQSALGVYEGLEKQRVKPLDLFYYVGSALGRDMRIDRIQVDKAVAPVISRFVRKKDIKKGPVFTAAMQMTFPSSTDAEKGNAEVQALQGRIQALIPDHIVKVTKLLEDYEYSEGIVVETGDVKNKKVSQDFVAEIKIEGPPQE
ncbi:MAG: hypothetical protein KDI13_03285 [Alphaproteobacteria bacterium]|nr:hypothetical protein [Alphaproteobacteria bacterium]